ncbi:hypothetical protein Poli38472_014505 [Pythium oligandrum]|uniref:PX domain-containing protein n=1 Tax=Pythium oligandrum TaxID=41045 RepID=A0A8K1CCV0_PYTOL|nr:hypothetical protein Poli38472_014505 [Pythium oligandrum]|eukprot:TMW61044.1 hypothetical protein Poli38472_014505 [Pythium oligandrum]
MWRRLAVGLVALVALHRAELLPAAVHAALWTATRLGHVVVLFSGGIVFWWLLRSYQLATEQELFDDALSKYKFYQKYRPRETRSASGTRGNSYGNDEGGGGGYGMLDAGFQLKVVKRLPIVTHLRTSWNLPTEICEEIATFVNLAVRDYVSYWFQPISANEEFPHDVRFLLADMLGALAARLLEIDSSLALTIAAKSIEILRLHLGWFREAYAQMSEEHPQIFQGEESDENLQQRQALIASYAQKSQFLHPGCVAPPTTAASTTPTSSSSSSAKKAPTDPAEVLYLRHVATQLLVQLKPEFGVQAETNLFVSMVLNLLRESLVFRSLKPLVEYSQPRYANELVVSILSAEVDEDSDPLENPTAPSSSPVERTSSLSFSMPQLNPTGIELRKPLNLTKTFLYRASKRSTEQAEAAFQAVVGAVSTAASHAGIHGNGHSLSTTSPSGGDVTFDTEFWNDSLGFSAVSPLSPTSNAGVFLSPRGQGARSSGSGVVPTTPPPPSSQNEKKGNFVSMFSLEDRINFPKAPRFVSPRMPLGSHGRTSSQDNGVPTTHMEDLKNMRANLESSLNSSLFKVKKKFRDIGGQLHDPLSASIAMPTSTQAANLMKRPGKLFQKALRRAETAPDGATGANVALPVSPVATADLFSSITPPPTPPSTPTDGALPLETTKSVDLQVADRVLTLLDKTVASYLKMYQERPEMRSSARSKELYALVSALEDVCMLGYHRPDPLEMVGDDGVASEDGPIDPDSDPAPPLSPASLALMDPGQLYWNYLACDRPASPFLNEHWRYVATQCPQCADTESFYSTRGVQWLLIALERGVLWEYFTGLHLSPQVTQRFYDEQSVLRQPALIERVLKTLLPLNQLRVSLEIPHVLGRKSDLEDEWGVTVRVTPASRTVRVVESVWEVERYVPIQGWVKMNKRWMKDLPSSEWIWENEWTLEASRLLVAGSDSSDVESSQSWEYAKTFDDRFHEKERKFDSVRRRKWTRRRRHLAPVLTLASTTTSVNGNSSSSPRSVRRGGVANQLMSPTRTATTSESSTASPRRHSLRGASWEEDDVDGAGGLRRRRSSLLKRRSSSFDKTMMAAALSAQDVVTTERSQRHSASLAAPLSAPLPQTAVAAANAVSAATTAAASAAAQSIRRKRDRVANALNLRRAIPTALTKDTIPAITTSVVDIKNEEEAVDTEMEVDDDDGSLCFRCFTPLGAESPSKIKSQSTETCQNCNQRVCAPCHAFYAFLVYPPPSESARKEQVCGNCYDRLVSRYKLRLEAHVGKYFIKEKERDFLELFSLSSPTNCSVSSPTAASSTWSSPVASEASSSVVSGTPAPVSTTPTNSSTNNSEHATLERYEITVQSKDESTYAWSVLKTYQDFEALEKKLYDKLKKQEKKHGSGTKQRHLKGVDYAEIQSVTPSLKQLPASPSIPYEKRLYILEEFLQRLLACDTLCQSSVVQKFLLLNNAGLGLSSSSSSSTPWSPRASGDAGELPTGAASAPASGSGSAGNAVLVENGRWKRGKWIAPELNSKSTKMRVLQQLEVSLFATLNEVFEFDGISMVRRHLFSMTRSFVKAFLSASHFRMLERQFLSFTDPKRMASMILNFREYMFPEPDAALPPPPAELSPAEFQALRQECLDAILASFPSKAVSLFGETSCENAALKLHEFVQHEIFVKNLMFSVVDEVLQHLFPDTVTYTRKTRSKST